MELEINDSTLFYRKEGAGKKNLLMFHGFGQDHTAFDSIRNELTSEYTCYSFDLYFHGKSEWPDENVPVSKAQWKRSISDVLEKNNLEKFSVVSFSIGARFLMATLEAFPGKINEVFLIAPDGITVHFWYWLATRYAFFRNVFKSITERPENFFSLLKIAHKCGIIRKELSVFARHQMRTPEKRWQVYKSWVVFRELYFPAEEAAMLINQFDITVNIVIGKYDYVIPEKSIAPLLKYLGQYSLDIAEAGHRQLLNKEFLLKLLCQKPK